MADDVAVLVEIERVAQVAAAQVKLFAHQRLFQFLFRDGAGRGGPCLRGP
jgi:hypothetical protein